MTDRVTRIAMYADWLEHDADGLAFNLAHPLGKPLIDGGTILIEARKKLLTALAHLDEAIKQTSSEAA